MIPVQPKVLDLLIHLAKSSERMVPQDEIFQALWPSVSVSADALYRIVKEARAAVGDDGRRQAVLQTVPGRGLRFVAALRVEDASKGPASPALSPWARGILRRAAALGIEFELSLLTEVSGKEGSAVLSALDEASSAGMIRADSSGPGRYAFADPGLRESFYSALPPSDRLDVHHRAARALERRHAGDLGPIRAELSRHYRETVARDGSGASLAHGLAAAQDAMEREAFDDALELLAELDRLLELDPSCPVATRCELLIEHSRAARRALDMNLARSSAMRGAVLAGAEGASALLARCLLAVPEVLLHGAIDREWVVLAERALAGIDPEPSPLRGELLNRLAYQLYWSRDERRSRECNQEARAIGVALGDSRLLSWVSMIDHMLHPMPSDLQGHVELAQEALAHAIAADDGDSMLYAREQVVNDAFQLGDFDEVEEQALAIERLSESARLPWPSRVGVLLALYRGDFTSAERRILQQQQLVQGAAPVLTQYLGPQLMWLRLQQGRIEEVLPLVRMAVSQANDLSIWRAALAVAEWGAGHTVEARREYESVASRDFRDVPENFLGTPATAMLSDVCCSLGDTRRSAILFERLKPHTGRFILLPRSSICLGPADHLLGRLAELMGQPEAAESYLRAGLEGATRSGGRPAMASAHLELSLLLSGRGSSDGEAQRHAQAALELGQAMGMPAVVGRASEILGVGGIGFS